MAKRSKAEAAPAESGPAGEEQNVKSTEKNVQQDPIEATGTTTALFGDKQSVPEQAAQVQEKEPKEVENKEPAPADPQPEEFYLEDVLSKQNIPLDKVKARIKVDGKEEVITFDEFRKRVQLKTHIDQAGQELGRQRREVLELKKELEKERNKISPVPASADPNIQRAPSDVDPYIAQLERRLAEIESRTAPVVYDVNRQQLSKQLSAQGFNDFLDYLPRIEAEISKIQDPNEQLYYDTPEGATQLFLKLKNQDLMEQLKQKTESPKPAPTERPKPPIQKIDGGVQPTTVTDIDDWQAKRDELYNKWVTTHEPTAKRKLLHQLMAHQNVISFK